MDLEIEAKFVSVDHDVVRARLSKLGAVCEHPLTLMRRVVYHSQNNADDAFVRVRDEGHRITMTYKQFDDPTSIHGVKEIETTVGDFDAAIAILDKTDMTRETYQETKREIWRLGDVEVMLDEWPWVDPFIEVEGPSEQAVKDTSEKLGFDWNDAVFGGVASVYVLKYTGMGEDAATIINRRTPVIRFEDPVSHNFKLAS